MAYDQNVHYLSLAFWQIIMTAGPILGIALAIGLFIGLIQAATSIQEMTLTFVPKIIAIFISIVVFLPFMITTIIEFANALFDRVSNVG